jgi:hypothetical protein
MKPRHSSLIPVVAFVAALLAVGVLAPSPANADVTIQSIQQLTYPVGTIVEIDGVVVTAAGTFGFFVQEPTVDTVPPRKFSGIWVYAPAHTFHKGDLVNVKGTYTEYFGQSEIDPGTAGTQGFFIKVGTTAVPAPVVVPMSSVRDGGADAPAYEGVLIRVDATPGQLTSVAPSGQALAEYTGLSGKKYWTLQNMATGDSISVMHENARAGDDFMYGAPNLGTNFTHLQGVLEYIRERYRISPRSCELDFGAGCVPTLKGAYSTGPTTMNVQFDVDLDPVTAQTATNYSLATVGATVNTATLDPVRKNTVHLTTSLQTAGSPEQITVSNVKSIGNMVMAPGQTYNFRAGITTIYQIQFVVNPAVKDSSTLAGATVTVEARVSGIEGGYYYLQEGAGGQWRGLYCRVAKSGNINVGDKLQVSGLVSEYFFNTELIYTIGVDNFVNLGPDPNPVVVNTLAAADVHFRDATRSAERWEGNLLRLLNVTLLDSTAVPPGIESPYYGEYLALPGGAGTDTASISIKGMGLTGGVYDACPGNRINITGVVNYDYYQYRIYPRSGRGGDIIELYAAPGCPTTGVDPLRPAAELDLRQNRPNPFGLETSIGFTLPRSSQVRLEVVDVSGRLVKVLAAGPLTTGEHIYQWNGMTESGHHAAAGTYFYRLRCDGKDTSRRMVMLN